MTVKKEHAQKHLVADAGAKDGLGGVLRELDEGGQLLSLDEGLQALAQLHALCDRKHDVGVKTERV
jgi:hypothetical protein